MTFLPIVERELRVRARSRTNYWGRFAVATVGVVMCAPPLLWSGRSLTPGTTGRSVFNCMVGAVFLLCCAPCLVTADAISGERREGTLGLLLLTWVRHFDVLLGKFASNGLTCLLGLAAVMPVLVLPLLTGGVTGGEVARTAAALLNTLFLALSVGLWASARGFEWFRTMRAAFLLLAALVLGPGLLGMLMRTPHAGLLSPLGTMFLAADLTYQTAAGWYWLSLAVVQLIAWTLLSSAVVCLRNRVSGREDGPSDCSAWTDPRMNTTGVVAPPAATAVGPASPTPLTTKCSYCGRLNQSDAGFCYECGSELRPEVQENRRRASRLSGAPKPLHWLLRRQRGLQSMVWVAAVLSFGHLALMGVVNRSFGWNLGMSFIGVSSGYGLISSAISGALFAWVASRFFVEARRTGELELLLTTPLAAEHIVSAQWETLLQLIRLPLAVMLLPMGIQALSLLSFGDRPSDAWRLGYAVSMVLSVSNTILGVCALSWLGMWFGLRLAGQGRVILWTVLLAKGIPYVVSLAWAVFYEFFVGPLWGGGNSWSSFPWLVRSATPQVAILLYSIWLVHIAGWQLSHEMAGAEPLDLRQILSRALPRMAASIRRARQWPRPQV